MSNGTKWFTGCATLDAAKARYKELAKRYHPDINPEAGDEAMQQINAEYDEIVKRLSRVASDGCTQATEQEQRTAQQVAQEYRAVILAIIHLDGLEVELCGSWLWVTGNTRAHKEALKAAGLRWSAKKTRWYWRPQDAAVPFCRRGHSMEYIRDKYGSTKITDSGEARRYCIAD